MRRALLALPLLLAGCGREPTRFDPDSDADFDGISAPPGTTAGPNGAYIVSRDGTVWWVNGAKAERVAFPPKEQGK